MQRRVDRAKDLLADPQEPLCQIALSVGFSSQSHFTEAFRQREDCHPRVGVSSSEVEEGETEGKRQK
jgi:AraC-like DNA-binding protein